MSGSFKRVLVVGTTGSGKTTLARRLSDIGGLPHVELDELRYERDWQEVAATTFRERVAAVVGTECWVVDGNYAAVRELTWSRAELVVWMDYSMLVVLRRLLGRTVRRLTTKADAGNGNREQLGRLLGRRSILVWAVRSHAPLRKEYEMTIATPRANAPRVVRLRSPSQTRAWLAQLRNGAPGLVWLSPDR